MQKLFYNISDVILLHKFMRFLFSLHLILQERLQIASSEGIESKFTVNSIKIVLFWGKIMIDSINNSNKKPAKPTTQNSPKT